MGFTVNESIPTKYGFSLANQFCTLKGIHGGVVKFMDHLGVKKWKTDATYYVYVSTDTSQQPLYTERIYLEVAGNDPPTNWFTLLYDYIKANRFANCTFVDDNTA